MFNFSQFLEDAIHEKFINFTKEEVFQYSSVLVYMFVYSQADRFQFAMTKLNEEGEPQYVIFWTTLLMKDQKNFTYKKFIEMFVHPAMIHQM